MAGKLKNLAFLLILLFLTFLLMQPYATVKAENQNQSVTQIIPNNVNNVTALNVTVLSPENKTYNKTDVPLNFTLESNAEPAQLEVYGSLFWLYCAPIVALDRETSTVTNIIENDLYWQFPVDAPVTFTKLGTNLYSASATFTNLSQGYHNVTIGVVANLDYISYGVPAGYSFTIISFNVDSIPPNIAILNLQNKTYTTGVIPIEFTANKTLSTISYSVDGEENITTQGNFTLSNLSNGFHNITVYATDEAGNIGSKTVTFAVEKPEVFGNVLLVAIIAVSIVIICSVAGLLFLRRCRKIG